MREWMATGRRMLWVLAFSIAFSCATGYLECVMAQKESHLDTDVAVNTARIENLEVTQTSLSGTLSDLRTKVDAISDRLSTMQGIGTGAICLLTMLQLAGFTVSFYNKKP